MNVCINMKVKDEDLHSLMIVMIMSFTRQVLQTLGFKIRIYVNI